MNYIEVLSKDKVMASLIAKFGELPPIVPVEDLFQDIVRTIVGQQLSVKAADTIYVRVLNLVGTSEPTEYLKHEDAALRACGLSFAKIKYIKSLCQSVINKEVDLENLRTMKEDQHVIDELVKLKGIGVWTAEMLLILVLEKRISFHTETWVFEMLYQTCTGSIETTRKR